MTRTPITARMPAASTTSRFQPTSGGVAPGAASHRQYRRGHAQPRLRVVDNLRRPPHLLGSRQVRAGELDEPRHGPAARGVDVRGAHSLAGGLRGAVPYPRRLVIPRRLNLTALVEHPRGVVRIDCQAISSAFSTHTTGSAPTRYQPLYATAYPGMEHHIRAQQIQLRLNSCRYRLSNGRPLVSCSRRMPSTVRRSASRIPSVLKCPITCCLFPPCFRLSWLSRLLPRDYYGALRRRSTRVPQAIPHSFCVRGMT